MGVIGLWQILQPTGRPTKLQGLEGKKLAIDISIWLHQANKGVRGSANGHILVLYNRICKLLYFKIKPIFVFDGPNVPKLKQRVLKERQRRRNAAADKAKNIQGQIQKNILENHILKSLSGIQSENAEARTSKSAQNENSNIDDLFILKDNPNNLTEFEMEADEDKKTIKIDPCRYEYIDLEDMDPDVFESLPDDIKFDILLDQKQRLKEKKSLDYEEFPQKSDEFSNYQMNLLLKKSSVSSKINELKKNIKSEYSAGTDFDDLYHQKVASEADSEVVLFTKKVVNKFTAKNILEQIHAKKTEESEDEDICSESKNEPTFRIEFNADNKIELVSYSDEQKIDQIDKSLEEKYIKIDDDPVTDAESTKNDEKINEIVCENDVEEIFEVSLKNQKVLDKKKNHVSNSEEIIKIAEINDETDDEDDDFVEVKDNEAVLIKEMIEINKMRIQSQNEIQETDKSQSDFNIKALNEIQDNLEAEKIIDLEQMENLSSNLVQETNRLLKEKELNERLSGAVERHIIDDAKLLLQLFGLPYVQSPSEAEAQCAFLDYSNQTDGSITEDSDVWLFGAKKVYKNFFGTDQFIDFYSDSVIKSQTGLGREDFIDIALLVGSDYTEGVENIGIVKAVEILNEFEGSGLEKLKNFKEWLTSIKNSKSKCTNKVRQAFLKLNLSESFPSELVYHAYINPDIDKSTEEFSWSMPDLDSIRKFMVKKMSWPVKKIDDDLIPIMRRLNETCVQKTIENYFVYDRKASFSKQSKRMKKAIGMFRSKSDVSSDKSKELNLSEDEERLSQDSDIILIDNEASTSFKRKSSESSLNSKAKKQTKSSNKKFLTKKK